MQHPEIALERIERIPSRSQAGKFAYRFTLLYAALTLRECYARREKDRWTIIGPRRREGGRAVILADIKPEIRAAIGALLDAALEQTDEVAA